jgi:toxin secretion/phage lysis holin
VENYYTNIVIWEFAEKVVFNLKTAIVSGIGVAGTIIASLFGGWTTALTTLCIFMGIDFITGLTVAGVFHKSPKTKDGALESKTGFKGLCRKCLILFFVIIGYRLDVALGSSYIKDGVCISFIANELISIIENAGLMGVPLPKLITDAISLLNNKHVK